MILNHFEEKIISIEVHLFPIHLSIHEKKLNTYLKSDVNSVYFDLCCFGERFFSLDNDCSARLLRLGMRRMLPPGGSAGHMINTLH